MYTDEFINKYPVEEATCEEYDYDKALHSIIFPYPEILQKHGCGELISFWTDGINTYFETSGEKPSNAGVFKLPRVLTDMELYEFVVADFKRQIEDLPEFDKVIYFL